MTSAGVTSAGVTSAGMTKAEEEDVALKILHTADWHLGLRFPSFGEEAGARLTRARLAAVGRTLDLAESYSVDAVLCAGDLFDTPAPEEQWWKGLLQLLQRRGRLRRPIVLLPGNHDPLQPNSVWWADHPFRRELPGWVHVVDRDNYELKLSEEAVIYAIPCRSQAGAEDQALRLPGREVGDERIRIGLAHGQTFDMAGYQTNFPISGEAAQLRGLNYLAIGDTHGFRELPPRNNPTVYPGAPEGTRFGEVEAGFAAVVLFMRHGRAPVIQKHRVGAWTWRDRAVTSLGQLEGLRAEDLRNCVVRLTLRMAVSLKEMERVERVLEEMKGTDAAQGLAGVLQVIRGELELDTSDAGSLRTAFRRF